MNSELSIYDSLLLSSEMYIPTEVLTTMLHDGLVGMDLNGLSLRTRSKVVKSKICEVLGYPIPSSFAKTKPRFPSQNFDIFVQKSMNVQIWNEEIDANRRYIFFRADERNMITAVKIVNGDQLAILDKTGKLTTKYQATMKTFSESKLFSECDTDAVSDWCCDKTDLSKSSPVSIPVEKELLPINKIFERLKPLEGSFIEHIDFTQERNRGAELHKLICQKLGYHNYLDNGTYPDIRHQLLEIKLQTSPTIDLGLHSPDDNQVACAIPNKSFFSHDIRYVIVDGKILNGKVLIRHLYLVNGRDFSKQFPLFKGKVQNAKLQIPLPSNFFNS
jgi:hypothetical protein